MGDAITPSLHLYKSELYESERDIAVENGIVGRFRRAS
jgi:hypothetical protein